VLGSEEEQTRSLDALRDAAPWMRRRLGERLRVRHVPELSVRRDESIESGDRVLRLLRELEDERA
jgi:ribosome-binding factor A